MDLSLHHKKTPKRRGNALFVCALFVFAFFAIFPTGFNAFSSEINTLILPFWNAGNSFGESANANFAYLRSKRTLQAENDVLIQKNSELQRELQSYHVIVQQNLELSKKLSIKKPTGIFADIISRPDITPYDTFLLSVGMNQGIHTGDMAISGDNIAVGTVDESFPYSAKVRLYSAPDRTTDALLEPSNTPISLSGSGGGSFTADMPHDLDVQIGDAVVLPGSPGYIVAYVQAKDAGGTNDSFQKVYFSTPMNIFELKYIQILKGNI